MPVGVLIVSHERIAPALLDGAVRILGRCPVPVDALPVALDTEPGEIGERIRERLDALDSGEGVLMLTDLFGSTPSNVACGLANGRRVRVVAGVNLPMLLRVFNYAHLALPELADKAVNGGRDGVFYCEVTGG